MPNETATSNSANCSAWQQSSSTNPTIDTPPDSTILPVCIFETETTNKITLSFLPSLA